MKKLLLIAVLSIGLMSCKKNYFEYTAINCGCGTVSEVHITPQSKFAVTWVSDCDPTKTVVTEQTKQIQVGEKRCDLIFK